MSLTSGELHQQKTFNLSASVMDNQELTTAIPPPPISAALTEFQVFPKLPVELQNKVWSFAAKNPQIINLRLTTKYWAFFAHNRPVFEVSVRSRTESKRSLPLVEQRLHTFSPNTSYFYTELSSDIFFLQLSNQFFREPDERQKFAISQPSWLQDCIFACSGVIEDYEFFPNGNIPPSADLIENVAVHLSLAPFDFPFNTEDEPFIERPQVKNYLHDFDLDDEVDFSDPDSYKNRYYDFKSDKGSKDDPDDCDNEYEEAVGPKTNIENWAAIKVAIFLDIIFEGVLHAFPKVKKLHVVVPEKKVVSIKSHYAYNGFEYPKMGEKAFISWTAATDGHLMYGQKVLGLIEKEMHRWHKKQKLQNPKEDEYEWRGYFLRHSELPKLGLVFADYEGRGNTVE